MDGDTPGENQLMTNREHSHTAIKVQAKVRVAAADEWRTALHHHVSRQYAPDAGENQTQTQQRVCVRSAGWDLHLQELPGPWIKQYMDCGSHRHYGEKSETVHFAT